MIVEKLQPSDILWYVEEAAVSMLTNELKRPELINKENLYRLAFMGIEQGTAFVCKDNGVPIGALGALIIPNIYNPEVYTLAEMFWYVPDKYRNSRAGLLLLNALLDEAELLGVDCSLSTLPSSNVKESFLKKKGFNLEEFSYRKRA